MRPPGDRDFAPLGRESRMVAFFFCRCADVIGEGDSVFEVFELEQTIQFGNIVLGDDLPLGYFRVKLFDFLMSH